jgi:hypothetical protein
MAIRSLSNSEIETALTCWAKWDFQYGGHLAGSTLKQKIVPVILSRGRAWGAAMQAYHGGMSRPEVEFYVRNALTRDQLDAREKGVLLPQEMLDGQHVELMAMFHHYAQRRPETYQGMQKIEQEINVPIPSRTSALRNDGGYSNRYHFQAFLDWSAVDPLPGVVGEWIIETKLRSELHSLQVLERSTQLRWYAWAYWQATGRMPAGVIVDTWLALIPKVPRVLVNGKLSHSKDQVTTSELYLEACRTMAEDPDPALVSAFNSRVWGQQAIIAFTPEEIREAGQELVGAAQLIRNLDNGEFKPIRHASPRTCNACRYKGICSNPMDTYAVEADFVRDTPKRLKPPRKKEVANAG